MKCPYCNHSESKVVDSRATDNFDKIRRRRECLKCGKRFTTYEVVELLPVIVIKRDKAREEFSREKIVAGLLKSCEKRPISLSTLEALAHRVEDRVRNECDKEVEASKIGGYVLEELKNIDKVAYIRFASVFRRFDNTNSFLTEVKNLLEGN